MRGGQIKHTVGEMLLRKLKITKKEIICFLVGFIFSHYLDLRRILEQSQLISKLEHKVEEDESIINNDYNHESYQPINADYNNEPEEEKEITLTDDCLARLDPEKLDFSQIANLRTEDGDSFTSKKANTFLLTLIMTGPFFIDKRNAIRETWLKNNPVDTKHYFVIGTKNIPRHSLADLNREQQKYKDLLLMREFEDSYDNLSIKLLHMITWAYENIDFKFLFKADDDTFARIDNMFDALQDEVYDKFLYWGYFYGKGSVKKSGQWAEHDWFLCEHYLPNARGGGYVISRELAGYVSRNSAILQTYKSEDITMGTWLAPLKIKRQHDIRFDTEFESRGCSNSWIVTHKQDENMMREKTKKLKDSYGKEMCQEEVSIKNGYEYRWDVPNSKCCVPNSKIP